MASMQCHKVCSASRDLYVRAMLNKAHASPLFWSTLAPALFVFLWSSGFVATKAGLTAAEPMTFLSLRFALVVAIMLVVAAVQRASWPKTPADFGHTAIAGLLVQGGYLGGVFVSMSLGLPGGIAALIVGLQPLLTATVVGPFLGERVRPLQWAGLLLGLAGTVLVLADKLSFDRATIGAVAFAVMALLGITFGTLYQKRFCGTGDLRTGAVIQFAAAGVACLIAAAAFETMQVAWTVTFAVALGYLVVVLSIGTVSLLYLLLRRGAAAKTASLFYLVPPVTALMTWALFDERLGPPAIAGMVIAALGVALVQRG
jgi:drug/metabolite transporter (DMT)-like permease